MTTSSTQPTLLWDIFCKVIDNHGDLGVCWRLSCQLAARGQRVRLWVDDFSALSWMAPGGCPGVEVKAWTAVLDMQGLTYGDVWVEAFGCEIAHEFIAAYANVIRGERGQKHVWINLEYLSAQDYVARNHGLTSPVMSGPGAGLNKHFFYPGFTPNTGGLLRELELIDLEARFDRDTWLMALGLVRNDEQRAERRNDERLVSLFCYEPSALPLLLAQLANADTPTRLLVTAGRASTAVQNAIEHKNRLKPLWNLNEQLSISYLPYLRQDDFDRLLWACDLNFVRGEDSLVRAIWAGKPFIWQIYQQHDDVHHDKLDAFLDRLQVPESLRQFHYRWNGIHPPQDMSDLPLIELGNWGETCRLARQRLLHQDDLVSQLQGFVRSRRG
jgi:uncharacterized repeat protein (TIGR03837 family)